MEKRYRITLMIIIISLLFGCASLPLLVEGEIPPKMPVFIKAYDGDTLPREQTSMLLGAKFEKQTAIYIIGIDGRSTSSHKGLTGGPEAIVVLPGTHDLKIQFRDKGRITMSIDLPGVNLDAGVGYLIDFKADLPPSIDGNYNQLSAIRINMMIVNLETKNIVYQKMLNGWGKEVNQSE